MSRESAITFERLRNLYCVPPDHPAPDELRSRLDGLAQSEVMDACRRALASWVDDRDPSIWLISSIDVDLAIDVGAEGAWRGAAAWGEQIALEIARAIQCGPAASVLRFPDRAAYVAQWARDMAAGQAWSKWYYRAFDSLRSLPQSAAIAEGIIREGEEAVSILLRLHSMQALEPVLEVVSNADARRVWTAIFPAWPDRWKNVTRWVSRLLALWRGFAPRFQGSPSREVLRFAIAALAEWPVQNAQDAKALREAVEGLREAVEGLLELRRVLDAAATPEMARLILDAAIAQPHGEGYSLPEAPPISSPIFIGSSLSEFIREVSGGDPQWAAFAAAVVAPHSAAPGPEEEMILSELGGIFLLASAFSDLQIDLAMHSAAQPCDEPTKAAAVLRHLLAVRCLGRSRAALAVHDRAVREFSGISSNVTLSEMAAIFAVADVNAALHIVSDAAMERPGESPLADLPEEHWDYFAMNKIFPEFDLDADRERLWVRLAASLLRNFAGRLPGFARSSPEYIFQNFLSGTSQLRVSDSRIEVRLAQSPLSVVLRIAGMYRNLALPWREGVEICLQAPPA
jgi:hypothetical protein